MFVVMLRFACRVKTKKDTYDNENDHLPLAQTSTQAFLISDYNLAI